MSENVCIDPDKTWGCISEQCRFGIPLCVTRDITPKPSEESL